MLIYIFLQEWLLSSQIIIIYENITGSLRIEMFYYI